MKTIVVLYQQKGKTQGSRRSQSKSLAQPYRCLAKKANRKVVIWIVGIEKGWLNVNFNTLYPRYHLKYFFLNLFCSILVIVKEHNRIPSVFTYKWKGTQIINLINSGFTVRLDLQRATHCRAKVFPMSMHSPYVEWCIPVDKYAHYWEMMRSKQRPFWKSAIGLTNGANSLEQKGTAVLFVTVSFAFLLLISLVWSIFYCVPRFCYIHAKNQHERKLCIQAKLALQNISTSVLKEDDLGAKYFFDTCVICIENCK